MMGKFTEDDIAFMKYACYGSLSPKEVEESIRRIRSDDLKDKLGNNRNEDENMLARQYYIFKQIKDNQVNTSELERLLEYMRDEMDHQYLRKSHIETRIGFLMALWGLVFTALIQLFINDSLNGWFKSINIHSITVFIAIILGGISLLLLCLCIWGKNIHFFDFEDIEENLVVSIEFPELMQVKFIEGYSNSYLSNEKLINKKAKIFNHAVIALALFVVFVILIAMEVMMQ